MNRKDLKNIWLIILLFIIVLVVILNNKYAFGNTINYYKELDILNVLKNNYLSTKKLIPAFINDSGINMGTYNYVKYGLVNPLVILSYFVNVNLGDYYSILSVIEVGISIILLYKFLYSNGYNRYSILLTVSLIFISINIFNIMFNSIIDIFILPLVIMAFIGAKKRLESNKGFLLIISIFLISIINYTYLIPVIIGLIIYSIYSYYINNKVLLFKKLFWYLLSYIVPILVGLLMASFALIPIIDSFEYNFTNIISINYDLNIIIILSIIYGFGTSKKNRFLSIISLILLVLFNKYYLAFIVLFSILVCNFMDGIIKDNVDYKVLVLGVIISLGYLINSCSNLIMIIIFLFSVFIYRDTNKKKYLVIMVLFIFVSTMWNCMKINLYNKDLVFNNKYNSNDYNTLYQMFIGNEKIDKDIIGYKKYMNDKGEVYYKNDDVLYRGFATNNIISYEDYEKLNGLAQEEVMLTNIVADKHSKNEYVSYVKEIKLNKDKYNIKVKNHDKYIFKLNKEDWNKIIYIEFDVTSNNCGNSRIRINNVDKYISCEQVKYAYTISDNNIKEIVVNLSKGDYKIKNVKVFSLDYGRINNSKMELDEFKVLKDNSKIIGEINVSGDGYFATNIPYDNGYEVRIDGNTIKYERVNNNYIGMPISKGRHIISINYDTKYRLMSWFFSYLGLVFMWVISYIEKKRRFT